MKKSVTLKTISYVALLILISILSLSIFTISMKESDYYNEDIYFSSRTFVNSYMSQIDEEIYELIYNNSNYYSIYDGEKEIHFNTYNYSEISDWYYLIIYKDIALTNVELTDHTNNIESIKTYIAENENSKKVNIINGVVESESDIIQKIGFQYMDLFNESYYTIETEEITNAQSVEWITTRSEDFQIYTSYVEKFAENTEAAVFNNIIEKLYILENNVYFIIPIASVSIVLILLYLVIAIGYRKGAEGIVLNDFDKVPLEIIILVAVALGFIPFLILSVINQNYNAIISLIITAFLLIYILSVILFDTIIKRIKSKTLKTSTLIGRIITFIFKYLKIFWDKVKKAWDTFTYSTNITLKVLAYVAIWGLVSFVIVIFFQLSWISFILETILISIIIYKVIKEIKEFTQIENKLKEMYEGNNLNQLNKDEFGIGSQRVVKYLNDISNGFENAIQDRIKSERLKAELITNVSHDIKTPLTSIINYVDLLKQEDIQNEKAKEYIGILDNKSQRLKKLTEDLVEASKVSTGNISLNLEKINIIQLIKQALGEFEDRFNKRGLQIIIDNKEEEIKINADSRYMYRIIENLFSNIAKYALENSRVYIDIKKTQKSVIVEMKNISKDRLNISVDELMQRFVRGDKSRTSEGSGLGISIAQNLTELQNGEFKLKLDGDLFKVELEWKIN